MNFNLKPITEAETNIARNLARRLAGKWSLVDVEDLESVLLLWLYANHTVVEKYRGQVDGTIKLVTALNRKAHSFCVAEQQERSGYVLDYNSRYSLTQIERSLVAMFNLTGSSAIKVNPVTGEPVDAYDSSLDDARAAVLDVKLAFEKLDSESQMILIWKFEQEFTYRDLALLLGMSAPGARKKLRKVLRELQAILDGPNR